MADKKISQLTAASLPLTGTEVLPIVQNGSTVKVTNNDLRPMQIQSNATSGVLQITGPVAAATRVMTTPDANFTAARIDAAQSFTGDQTLSTGNLVIGTSGKGIDFSATAGTGTSELFSDYEEGTWTPVVADAATGGNVAAAATVSGTYTKIGRSVTINCAVSSVNTTGMTAGNDLYIRGLPYTNNATNQGNGVIDMRNTAFSVYPTVFLGTSTAAMRLFQHASGGGVTPIPISAVGAGSIFFISLTYTV